MPGQAFIVGASTSITQGGLGTVRRTNQGSIAPTANNREYNPYITQGASTGAAYTPIPVFGGAGVAQAVGLFRTAAHTCVYQHGFGIGHRRAYKMQ